MANLTQPPRGEPQIRAIAMPADANPSGDIFGGWLMAQMDLAAGSAAARRSHGRCVTLAVDGMVFHEPVFVGDEVSLYADLLRVGNTSMTIRVEAWRRSLTDEVHHKVTEATFTFVAVDENRKPRSVPSAPAPRAGPARRVSHWPWRLGRILGALTAPGYSTSRLSSRISCAQGLHSSRDVSTSSFASSAIVPFVAAVKCSRK